MRVPAAFVALPLVAGVSAGVLSGYHLPPQLTVAAAGASVLALVAAIAFFLDDDAGGVVAGVLAGAALAGFSGASVATRDAFEPTLLTWFERETTAEPEPVILEGVLRDDAASGDGGPLLTIDVRRVVNRGRELSVRGGVRVYVGGSPAPGKLDELRAGRKVRLTAVLRLPGTFNNPGVPDDRRRLALRGVALTGSVKSAALIEIAKGNPIAEIAASTRSWTRQQLQRYVGVHSLRSAAVATAIVIGDRTGLSDEDERRLQDAGTYHVIAISGGNIAILTVVLLGVARLWRVPPRAAAAGSIVLLAFYGEVAGGTASVGRAITAASFLLGALMADLRGRSLNVLAVTAVTALAFAPTTIADAGFLLSFGATVGIILGVPSFGRFPVERGVRGPARAWRWIAVSGGAVLAATICAEIALAPVSAALFSRVTMAGTVLNFGAIPLMTLVQCGSMAVLAVSTLHPPTALLIGGVVHHAAHGLVESSRFVELVPWMARDVSPPAWWLCVIYYGSCAIALRSRTARRPALAIFGVVAVVLVSGMPGSSREGVRRSPPGLLRTVVLDVGQGDASVVMLPGGHTLLVDSGGLSGTRFDMGSRVVLPALRALGVRRLHALVITHGDPDHVGGADALIRALAPTQIWEGVPVPRDPALRRLEEAAAARRLVWRTVRPGDVERAGGAEIRVLHPPGPDWERQRVRNDDSVVLEIRYRDVSIVLPGDIGRDIEGALVTRLQVAPLVILKAAHHGSATSSSDVFLDALNPRAVIFSAGRNNRFGHPAPAVLTRFLRRGVDTFNTAKDGAVFVDTDGRTVEVWGWKTRRMLRIAR